MARHVSHNKYCTVSSVDWISHCYALWTNQTYNSYCKADKPLWKELRQTGVKMISLPISSKRRRSEWSTVVLKWGIRFQIAHKSLWAFSPCKASKLSGSFLLSGSQQMSLAVIKKYANLYSICTRMTIKQNYTLFFSLKITIFSLPHSFCLLLNHKKR